MPAWCTSPNNPWGSLGFGFSRQNCVGRTTAVQQKVFHPMSLRHFELKNSKQKTKISCYSLCLYHVHWIYTQVNRTDIPHCFVANQCLVSPKWTRFVKVTYAVEKSCKQVQIYSESITKTVFLVTQACEYSYIKQRAYRNSQILEANSHKINSLLYVLQNHSQLFNLRDINLNKNKLLT